MCMVCMTCLLASQHLTFDDWTSTRVANSVAYDVSPLRAVSEQSTVKDPTSM